MERRKAETDKRERGGVSKKAREKEREEMTRKEAEREREG